MSDSVESMLGILPPLVLGGAALMLTERFLVPAEERLRRRRANPFDRQEYYDLRRTNRLGFGDFGNVGFRRLGPRHG